VEKNRASTAARAAIDQLPLGTTRPQLEQATKKALEPILVDHQRRSNKARLMVGIEWDVSRITTDLRREYGSERVPLAVTLAWGFGERIRERLEKRLNGDESDKTVNAILRQLLLQELGLQPKTP
jgi:hypothetical protein